MVVNGLMGLGRSVWENTNKAIYADFFQGSPQTITTTTAAAAATTTATASTTSTASASSAFACLYMVTGLSTCVRACVREFARKPLAGSFSSFLPSFLH